MDRLGDLVLTLPVGAHYKELREASWWIPAGLGFVAQSARPRPEFREVAKTFSLKTFIQLYRQLRKERYAQSLIFYAPAWVYLLIFLARIPVRAGRRSQWYSFLLLNRGLRQKRSLSEKNELSYNAELVEKTLKLKPESPLIGLKLTPSPKAAEVLKSFGLTSHGYIVIHPGMGGSALNWPTENYRKLIETLLERGEKVALTGTPADHAYTEPLRDLQPRLHWLAGKLSGPELLDVLSEAKWVLAPSTGVVHLAASLGTLTFGIYSPIKAESSLRWGPVGERVHILEPTSCPHSPECLQKNWPEHPCMKKLNFTGPQSDLDKG